MKFVLTNGIISLRACVHNACCITLLTTNISSSEFILLECVNKRSNKYMDMNIYEGKIANMIVACLLNTLITLYRILFDVVCKLF